MLRSMLVSIVFVLCLAGWTTHLHAQVEFVEHVITTDANGAWSVYAADVDSDGDMDVLSASEYDNKIAWYENLLITAIEDEPANLPQRLELLQNYPNPFNPTTTIQFSIPPVGATLASPDGRTRQAASLRVYNITGRLVKTLSTGNWEPGTHEVTWDGTNDDGQPVGSGVYFYRLQAGPSTGSGQGDTTINRRMILLK